MPSITAIVHTSNDALRLGRLLETLYPCDDIVVIDHGSQDGTLTVAREYGATILPPKPEATPTVYLGDQPSGWILCLDARESLTESLAASLFEWKSEALSAGGVPFSVFLREETAEGWVEHPSAQTRLVPDTWNHWAGRFPTPDASAISLEGDLLRFAFP
jgi:glycosyltransferase involved in cell wall biosynthesis